MDSDTATNGNEDADTTEAPSTVSPTAPPNLTPTEPERVGGLEERPVPPKGLPRTGMTLRVSPWWWLVACALMWVAGFLWGRGRR